MPIALTPACAATPQRQATPTELNNLRSKDPLQRIRAVLDIENDSVKSSKAAASLFELVLSENDSHVREIAAGALFSMRDSAKDLAPGAIAILKNHSESAERRARAAQILGAIGNVAAASIPPLADTLEDVTVPEPVRQATAVALVEYGRLPPQYMPRLGPIAFNPRENQRMRMLATQILGNAGAAANQFIPSLTAALTDRARDIAARAETARALGAIASESQVSYAVKPMIQVLLQSNDTDLRVAVTDALQAMRGTAKSALPTLRDVAVQKSKPVELRLAALDAIQRIGQDTNIFSSDLLKLAESPDVTEVRVKAAQALGSVGPTAADENELVRLTLDLSQPPELRIAAIGAIRAQNPATKDISPELLHILREEKQDPQVGTQAAQLLAQLKPVPPGLVGALTAIIGNASADLDLRRGAAYAAGMIGPAAAVMVPTLARTLRDSSDLMLRRQSCWAILAIGRNGEEAVSTLTTIVSTDGADSELRKTAVLALGAIGSNDKTLDPKVVPTLLRAFRTAQDPQMRTNTLAYLGQMDPGNTETVALLSEVVANDQEEPSVRQTAASAIGNIGVSYDVGQAAATLLTVLKSEKQPGQLRQSVASALKTIQPPPRGTVSGLIEVLKHSQDTQVTQSAAQALGAVGRDSTAAASALADVLADKQRDNGLRAACALALGRTGAAARPYTQLLLAALKDDDAGISNLALEGLVLFADQAVGGGDTHSISVLTEAQGIAGAKPSLARTRDMAGRTYLEQMRQDIADLQRQSEALKKSDWEALAVWAHHPYVSTIVLIPLVCYLICGLLFVFKPAWLSPISDFASQIDQRVPVSRTQLSVPLGWLILPPPLRFSPRTLDAWVRQRLPTARNRFEHLRTVSERSVYVDMPLSINGTLVTHFSLGSLRQVFDQERAVIVITGEGGAGKTTLACQVAMWLASECPASFFAHPMLPLLLEGDFAAVNGNSADTLQQAVRARLTHLLGDARPQSVPMIRSLLKHRRLLLVVDGFSEMSDAGRSRLQTDDPEFPARIIIVTSRREEDFPAIDQTIIEPARLEKAALGSFMQKYLEQRGKLGLLNNKEFLDKVVELQRLVGDRDVTPLFARLYIDQMMSSKEHQGNEGLPNNIPELVLQYVNNLNHNINSGRINDNEVQRLARLVARHCIMPQFRPAPTRIREVLDTLGGGNNAQQSLTYLETNVTLVQTIQPGEEVRFVLDPVAEYLAALEIVDTIAHNANDWHELFKRADQAPGGSSTTRDFFRALSDCYQYRRASTLGDDDVLREIMKRCV